MTNVLIIHTDQQRYNSLGCTGNRYAETPNIDALASDGSLFTRHIASNTVCMPSRASLFTGLTVEGHGVASNGMPLWRKENIVGSHSASNHTAAKFDRPEPLFDKIPTIADILSDKGYQTASFGKLHFQPFLADREFNFKEAHSTWENHDAEDWDGPYYGFQKVKLTMSHGESPGDQNSGHYGRWLWKNHRDMAKKAASQQYRTNCAPNRKDIYMSPIPSEIHNSMWIADQLCSYIIDEKTENRPFFTFVGFPDPHHPIVPPEDIARRFIDVDVLESAPFDERIKQKPVSAQNTILHNQVQAEDLLLAKRYTTASIALIDKAIGRILECLKANNLYDDTIIIFTSDHGDFLGDYGAFQKSQTAFHCLLHVPFIIKAAGTSLPSIIDTPMSNTDVLPTLLAMLGIDIPAYMQGKDIFSVDPDNHNPYVSCRGENPENGNFSIYDRTYRYTLYPVTGEEELYNHDEDPGELNNLAASTSTEVRKRCKVMQEKLLKLHAQYSTNIFARYSLW